MTPLSTRSAWRRALRSAITLAALGCHPATAACDFDVLGHGHVAVIIDDKTFGLDDGQEVRLAGIEPLSSLRRLDANTASQRRPDTSALEQVLGDREVTLRGPSAKPDRYGRLVAFAYVDSSPAAAQNALLEAGQASVAGDVAGGGARDCTTDLLAHEAIARRAKKGFWADPSAIKNTEIADDILPWIGRFIVAEGRIASVREAGGVVYVNFSRRWAQGFAVTISRRMMAGFEAAGLTPKTLENRMVRVRGWVEQRGGPRIEALWPAQIELVGDR
jgi:endonuclease YncB( thermonuclease family)